MSFCTNCGDQIKDSAAICPKCYLDPNIPEEIIDEEQKQISFTKKEKFLSSKIEFPGESSSLAFSIFLMIVIGLIFSAITLGIFIIYLLKTLFQLRIQQIKTKASLIKVSENTFHQIYKLSKLAAYRLKIPIPSVYIEQNPYLNASTSGFWGDHWIVLHSALLKQLNPEELLFIIGHEMGHIKREHVSWLILISHRETWSMGIISSGLKSIFNNWNIKSEYSADRAGLIANKNSKSCISALSMMATGHRNVKLESYLKKSDEYQKDPLSRVLELRGTHPYAANRIKKIYQFSKSINLD